MMRKRRSNIFGFSVTHNDDESMDMSREKSLLIATMEKWGFGIEGLGHAHGGLASTTGARHVGAKGCEKLAGGRREREKEC